MINLVTVVLDRGRILKREMTRDGVIVVVVRTLVMTVEVGPVSVVVDVVMKYVVEMSVVVTVSVVNDTVGRVVVVMAPQLGGSNNASPPGAWRALSLLAQSRHTSLEPRHDTVLVVFTTERLYIVRTGSVTVMIFIVVTLLA